MLNRMTVMTVWTAAVLALGAVVVAQNTQNPASRRTLFVRCRQRRQSRAFWRRPDADCHQPVVARCGA